MLRFRQVIGLQKSNAINQNIINNTLGHQSVLCTHLTGTVCCFLPPHSGTGFKEADEGDEMKEAEKS